MNSILYLLIFTAVSCSSVRPRYHTVVPHDSMAKVASDYGVSLHGLREANPDDASGRLVVGQKLFIPFEHSSSWDTGDSSVSEESSDSNGDDEDQETTLVRRAVVVRAHGGLSMSKKLNAFIWPVSGPVSSYFGMRRRQMHDGIDIVARGGTRVVAARSGHVIYATNRIGGYGNMVILRHVNGFATVYAHLKTLSVKRGQFALKGQKIGQVGRTGRASDYHLHFEIRRHREPINPLLYLRTHYVKSIVQSRREGSERN